MMDKSKSLQNILIVLLFVVGIFFSTYRLSESPSVWYDEGWYIQTATNWASVGIDGIQLSPENIKHISVLTVSYPLLYPLAVWFNIFGSNILAARSLMVIFLVGFLITAFLLAKRLFGKSVATAVLALLVTFPPLYANGKGVLGEVPGIMYLGLFLLSFIRIYSSSTKKTFWLIISGLLAGLAITTKPVFLLILPALLVGLFTGLKRKDLSFKDIGIGTIGLLPPMIVWLIVQFPAGTSLSNVLAFYANPYNINIFSTVSNNIKTLFSDVGTLYTVFLILVWSFSLLVRRRLKERVSIQEIIAATFSILVVIAYLRTAGLYRYLFYAQGIALIFLPSSIVTTYRFVFKRLGGKRIISMCYFTIIILCTLGLYQLMFNSWVANSYNSRKTAFWQEYFAHIPASSSVFFYDTPEVVPFIGHRNYYQFLKVPAGNPTGPEQLAVVGSGKADLIIVRTDAFEANESDIFNHYVVKEKAYKYSILARKL